MNFFKKNAVFLSVLGGFVVLLAGSILLLMQKVNEQTAVQTELDQKIEERNQLWKKDPFPKNENVTLLQKHAEEEKGLIQDALKLLHHEPIVTKRISGSECKNEIFSACQNMEGVLRNNSVKFPERFNFGFERYAIRPPEDDDTPMIQKQLKIIEELVRIMASAHFRELLSIRRVEFEKIRDVPVGGMPVPASTPSSLSRSPLNPATDPLIPLEDRLESVDNPSYIYSLMPFEVEIIGDTEALRSFFNGLARAPQIFLPRFLSIENQKKEPLSKRATQTVPTQPSASAPRPPGMEQPSEPIPIDPDELPFVLGEEKIVVKMRIDWVEFREPQKSSKDKK